MTLHVDSILGPNKGFITYLQTVPNVSLELRLQSDCRFVYDYDLLMGAEIRKSSEIFLIN
jgi:hypothetical protein